MKFLKQWVISQNITTKIHVSESTYPGHKRFSIKVIRLEKTQNNKNVNIVDLSKSTGNNFTHKER